MEAKEIAVQFNGIAKKYDENRRKFISCFDDFYFGATRFLADCISRPKSVLDLGAGTGLLSYYWYGCFPDSRYTLVDIAEDMLQIAKERFLGLENVNFEVLDYSLGLPEQEFDAVISALSIHHLENDEKDRLFKNIYDKLPSGGIFVNYDQFCAGSVTMNRWYDTYWESLLLSSGLSENELDSWRERRKLDRECSQEEETAALKSAGFKEVKCIYCNQKFAVLAAIK